MNEAAKAVVRLMQRGESPLAPENVEVTRLAFPIQLSIITQVNLIAAKGGNALMAVGFAELGITGHGCLTWTSDNDSTGYRLINVRAAAPVSRSERLKRGLARLLNYFKH